MVEIPILGWYNKRNIGDDAFKEVFEAIASKTDPGATITYYTQRKIPPNTDKIILGAGDVVRPFYLDRIPKEADIYIVGAGLGYQSEIGLLEGRSVPFALFRNEADAELARSHGIDSEYCPD
jgi:hypothetical protein